MWINKKLFDLILADNKEQARQLQLVHSANDVLVGEHIALKSQKAKDDITIDWMRHRVNALEKQNSILVAKAAGVLFPVPEIVPTRPGTMTAPINFDTMPSFEDAGDAESSRLGIVHLPDGSLSYTS